MLEFWTEGSTRREYRVGGLVIDRGAGQAAQEATDLCPTVSSPSTASA